MSDLRAASYHLQVPAPTEEPDGSNATDIVLDLVRIGNGEPFWRAQTMVIVSDAETPKMLKNALVRRLRTLADALERAELR